MSIYTYIVQNNIMMMGNDRNIIEKKCLLLVYIIALN